MLRILRSLKWNKDNSLLGNSRFRYSSSSLRSSSLQVRYLHAEFAA